MAEQRRREEEEETLQQTSDEIEKLEEDVKFMAQKIAEIRETLLDQLQNTLASILSAQRHVNLNQSDNYPESCSINPNPESRLLVEDDPILTEKIQRIKQKISRNTSSMSSLLKRLKDCMSRINELDSNFRVHRAFKRRKMTSNDCYIMTNTRSSRGINAPQAGTSRPRDGEEASETNEVAPCQHENRPHVNPEVGPTTNPADQPPFIEEMRDDFIEPSMLETIVRDTLGNSPYTS